MSYTGFGSDYLQAAFGSTYGYPFSVAMWIKKSAAQWADGNADYLFCFGENFTDDISYVRVYSGTDSVLMAVSAGGSFNTTTLAFTDGDYDDTWVPVVITMASSTDRDIYIEDSTNTAGGSLARLLENLDSFRLGRLMTAIGGFEGKIAEVALFNKVLLSGEIDALQTSAETGPAPNTVASADCIAYWPLATDQATHTDQSGNSGPSMTEQNTPTFDSDHPTIISGANVTGVPLVDIEGAAHGALSLLKWSWFDTGSPNSMVAPTDQGAAELTTAGGILDLSLPNSLLNSGQTGTLILKDETNKYIGAMRLQVD